MKLRLLTLCKVMRNELVMKTLPGAAFGFMCSPISEPPLHTLLYEVEEQRGKRKGRHRGGEGQKD